MFEPGLVASEVVVEKLPEVNKRGGGEIASARPATTILRNILHPQRQLAKVRFVMPRRTVRRTFANNEMATTLPGGKAFAAF